MTSYIITEEKLRDMVRDIAKIIRSKPYTTSIAGYMITAEELDIVDKMDELVDRDPSDEHIRFTDRIRSYPYNPQAEREKVLVWMNQLESYISNPDILEDYHTAWNALKNKLRQGKDGE